MPSWLNSFWLSLIDQADSGLYRLKLVDVTKCSVRLVHQEKPEWKRNMKIPCMTRKWKKKEVKTVERGTVL